MARTKPSIPAAGKGSAGKGSAGKMLKNGACTEDPFMHLYFVPFQPNKRVNRYKALIDANKLFLE